MSFKPCKFCWHKKGGHAYNPTLIPGGEWQPVSVSYPCQQKGCGCNDYQEATYEEKEQHRRDKIWANWKGEKIPTTPYIGENRTVTTASVREIIQ